MHRHPVSTGRTPAASILWAPRRACTVSSTSVDVDAEGIQCSFPATCSPVSSTCATTAAAILSRITARVLPVAWAAIRVVHPTRVAAATTTPNRSARAATVRQVDRNCPGKRYTPIPASRDPSCTGACTPAAASVLVTAPHAQTRKIS